MQQVIVMLLKPLFMRDYIIFTKCSLLLHLSVFENLYNIYYFVTNFLCL